MTDKETERIYTKRTEQRTDTVGESHKRINEILLITDTIITK